MLRNTSLYLKMVIFYFKKGIHTTVGKHCVLCMLQFSVRMIVIHHQLFIVQWWLWTNWPGIIASSLLKVKCLHILWILLMRSPMEKGWNSTGIRLFLKFLQTLWFWFLILVYVLYYSKSLKNWHHMILLIYLREKKLK